MKLFNSLKHSKLLLGIVSAFCILLNYNVHAVLPTVLDTAVNPANNHVYYLLTASDWTNAESEAVNLGGTLATVNDLAENNWILNAWGTNRDLWIGLFDPTIGDGSGAQHAADFTWASGDTSTYRNWRPVEPNNANIGEYWTYILPTGTDGAGQWNDDSVTGSGPLNVFGVVEVVPEPSSAALLACGVVAMLGGIWTHKRHGKGSIVTFVS